MALAEVGRLQALFGPAATKWFGFLQNKIRHPNKNVEIAARVAVDQCVFAPANLLVFLSTMSLLEGSDPREKLKRTYKDTMITNWTVWPFVQALNFKMVPLEHRVLVVNVVALGWNCYLSLQNSAAGK
ncbi:MAG: hypothetical protein M1823_005804 [Watsoniomyces obsoletus]|nr:MAG: hypothetical protein M1823_005804 [Watsoniomyces obsoletus]